jgi:hypothetical protein
MSIFRQSEWCPELRWSIHLRDLNSYPNCNLLSEASRNSRARFPAGGALPRCGHLCTRAPLSADHLHLYRLVVRRPRPQKLHMRQADLDVFRQWSVFLSVNCITAEVGWRLRDTSSLHDANGVGNDPRRCNRTRTTQKKPAPRTQPAAFWICAVESLSLAQVPLAGPAARPIHGLCFPLHVWRPIFITTLWAGASWLFFRIARSTRMTQIWALRSRLEKQPTDLRQNTSYFGDRTLESRDRYPSRAGSLYKVTSVIWHAIIAVRQS